MYSAKHQTQIQQQIDHIVRLRGTSDSVPELKKPSYGLDSPLGCASSLAFAPLYLYASLKGKHDIWDRLLEAIPDELFRGPTLDAGCGRGLVLLKSAQRKAKLTATTPAVGIDIFSTSDQSGK